MLFFVQHFSRVVRIIRRFPAILPMIFLWLLSSPSAYSAERAASVDIAKRSAATSLFREKSYDKAFEVVTEIATKHGCLKARDGKHCVRILLNLGFARLGQGDAAGAEQYFSRAQKIVMRQKNVSPLDAGDCLMGLGESNYLLGRFQKALECYSEALSFFEQRFGRSHPELIPALEGIGGTRYAQNEYERALSVFKRIAQIDLATYGPWHPRVSLSLNNLSDVYYKLGKCDRARPLFERAVWIFKKNQADRLCKQALSKPSTENRLEDLKVIRDRICTVVLGVDAKGALDSGPKVFELLDMPAADKTIEAVERSTDFDSWHVERSPVRDIGFMALDPRLEQKGIIVCLHGLGLHHGAYEKFAEMIIPRAYTVVAIDVRGFGSLSFEKGFDKVDLESGVEDLSALMSIIRSQSPDTPIFLLGESMGGALALQFTARYPDLVDGLVSSVPSGQRFKSRKTGLIVGLKLLEDASKPFAIGKTIVDQASNDEELKEEWLNDPASRLSLSPQELVHFQQFMNHNEQYAREIKTTPVLVLQGFKDHLVRPLGTYALYQELATSEKDMIFVGNSEHLILEEGQAAPEIVNMIAVWLDAHLERKICVLRKTAPKLGKTPLDIEGEGSADTSK